MTNTAKKSAISIPREEVQESFVSYYIVTSSRKWSTVIPSHHEA